MFVLARQCQRSYTGAAARHQQLTAIKGDSMRSSYVLVPALLTLLASNAQAQKSNTKGFMGNLHYARTSLKGEGADKTDMGNGAGVRLGWGFSDKFTAFLGLSGARLDIADGGGDYGLGQGDLGLTFNFANSQRALVPYLEIALTSQAMASTSAAGDLAQAGTGFSFGGGINYYFSRSAALQIGLNLSSVSFEDAEIDNNKIPDSGGSASGGKFMIGFNWYPMKR